MSKLVASWPDHWLTCYSSVLLMHLNLASLASQQGDKELSHQRDGGESMCPVAFEFLQSEASRMPRLSSKSPYYLIVHWHIS